MVRLFRGWIAAPLLAVALCLLAVGPASAADDGDELVVSVGQSDSLGLVKTAQSDGGTDADSGPDRRLVGRESAERVDAVVIALWTIAAVMTVLLGVFLWHTSPRRRLRLAEVQAAGLPAAAEAGPESAEDDSAGGESRAGPAVEVWERVLAWTRARIGWRQDAEPTGGDPEQDYGGESEDESAVWKFGEEDGGERSV